MIAQNVNINSFVSVVLEIARQSVLPQQKEFLLFGIHILHRSKNPLEQATRFLSLLTPSSKTLRNGRKPGLRCE